MNATTKYTREELLKALRNNRVVVTFTKVDGTKRDLFCTLKTDLIPQDKAPKNEKPIKENDNVIKVFALDTANGWRSFRVDSVTGMTIIGNEYA
jgi:hypothetical protein